MPDESGLRISGSGFVVPPQALPTVRSQAHSALATQCYRTPPRLWLHADSSTTDLLDSRTTVYWSKRPAVDAKERTTPCPAFALALSLSLYLKVQC